MSASTVTVPQNLGPVARSVIDLLNSEARARGVDPAMTIAVRYDLTARTLLVCVDLEPDEPGALWASFPISAFAQGITPTLRAQLLAVFK